ncbi:MAG TPA: transposase [Burkholderiaceae bacterium]|nr:transposase [Burkholderiaceae bacterium]
MPRRARLIFPEVPLHVIHRGNNRQACFFCDDDYQAYLSWLSEHSGRAGVRVHGYVLMTNHLHLLLSPENETGVGSMMKTLGQYYTHYFNRRYHRTGTLWEGRYKSSLVQQERYFLQCQRYIELNPVRAGLLADPAAYRWSSYRCNAWGRPDRVLSPHSMYLRLGDGPEQRQQAYRALFDEPLRQRFIDDLRLATNNGFAVGNQEFLKRVAEEQRRRLSTGSDPRV